MWITLEDDQTQEKTVQGNAPLHRIVFIKSKVCALLPDKRTAKRRLFCFRTRNC